MADEPNYTLSAFTEPLHLVALVIAALGAGVALGAQALLAVAVLEILYLVLVPRMVPYKRRARLKANLTEEANRGADRELKAARLSRDVRRRYQSLASLYQALAAQEAKLPVGMGDVEDLMDAALSLSLIAEEAAEAERRAPLAQLEARDPDGGAAAERRKLADHARAAEAQLGEIEAALQRLQNLTAGKRLESAGAQAAVTQDIEATLRTAREMAAYDLAKE